MPTVNVAVDDDHADHPADEPGFKARDLGPARRVPYSAQNSVELTLQPRAPAPGRGPGRRRQRSRGRRRQGGGPVIVQRLAQDQTLPPRSAGERVPPDPFTYAPAPKGASASTTLAGTMGRGEQVDGRAAVWISLLGPRNRLRTRQCPGRPSTTSVTTTCRHARVERRKSQKSSSTRGLDLPVTSAPHSPSIHATRPTCRPSSAGRRRMATSSEWAVR